MMWLNTWIYPLKPESFYNYFKIYKSKKYIIHKEF